MSEAAAAADAPPAAVVIDGLATLPGGRELLRLAAGRDDVTLVGGAVRDLLLGRAPRELDVVLARDAEAFARELALELAPAAAEVSAHERFGTAVLEWPGGRIDIATRRAESYPAPGALPDVRAGSVEEDLARRDFTVNALAVGLAGGDRVELRGVERAREDLAGGVLRVLHERSFLDDPTRLLRMARYSARLRFEPEPRTAELAAAAVAAGALDCVTRARIGAELRLALSEPDAIAALVALDRLGVLAAIDPRLAVDEPLARAAVMLLPGEGRPDLLALAVALLALADPAVADPGASVRELLDSLEFPAAERSRAQRTVLGARPLAAALTQARRPSSVHAAASAWPLESVALAGALADAGGDADAARAARRWLTISRHVELEISGDDLLAAGVPAGPDLGRRLDFALARKLDGELDGGDGGGGRDVELRAALEADA